MILNTAEKMETNCQLEEQTFKIAASPIAFEILSNKLYSDPRLAIVRELLTNAYDSHKLAGNLETPIKVHFPTSLDENFTIRDYGTGLSKEDVLELYTTFFTSTKNTTNDFTGCFGLGSKTPFSYTSSFVIRSYYNGVKYSFLAIKKNGLPSIMLTNEEATEEHNGLEINIPTTLDNSFLNLTRSFIRFIPEINISCDEDVVLSRPEILFEEGNIKIYNSTTYSSFSNIILKQGQNLYAADASSHSLLAELRKLTYLIKTSKNHTVVAEVPIGSLDITPSREALTNNEKNEEKIYSVLAATEESIKKLFTTNLDAAKTLDANIYENILNDKYFKDQNTALSWVNNDLELRLIGTNTVKNYNTDFKEPRIHLTQTQYIILATTKFNNQDSRKIANICENYPDDIDGNVAVVIPNKYTYTLNELKQEIKYLRDVVNICNTIEEHPEINIQLISLPRFYRMFPNTKKTKQVIHILDSYFDRYIKCERYTIYISNGSWIKASNFNMLDVKYLPKILNTYKAQNTLIVDLDFPRSYLNELLIFINKIRDKKGNNFLIDYLQKKKKLDFDCDTINILFVAKSNKRFFKDYPKLKKAEFQNIISKTKWCVECANIDYLETNIDILHNCKNMLETIFKGKEKNYISKTLAYKAIDPLLRYYEGILIDAKTKFSTVEYQYLSRNYPNNIINKKLCSIMPQRLSKLLDMISDISLSKVRTSKTGQTAYRHKLSTIQKLQVLKILKGDYDV